MSAMRWIRLLGMFTPQRQEAFPSPAGLARARRRRNLLDIKRRFPQYRSITQDTIRQRLPKARDWLEFVEGYRRWRERRS
jgi:hypothetical protein